MNQVLAALEANHKWHHDHDEYDGYDESELCAQNMQAIATLKALVMNGSTKRHLLRLADAMATAKAALDIPTGALYRSIAADQFAAARDAFLVALDAPQYGDAQAHVVCTCPDCVKPRPTMQRIGTVTRYGRRSDGKPWVGIRCSQNGDVDPPDGVAVYAEVPGETQDR